MLATCSEEVLDGNFCHGGSLKTGRGRGGLGPSQGSVGHASDGERGLEHVELLNVMLV